MEHFKFSDFLFCVSIICLGRIYYSACVQLAQFMCELAALPHENMDDLSFTWWQHTKLQILFFGLGTVCVCFKCGACNQRVGEQECCRGGRSLFHSFICFIPDVFQAAVYQKSEKEKEKRGSRGKE